MTSPRTVAKVGGALVAVLIAYRGIRLFIRNDVTISITELVRLPPAAILAATAGRNRAGGNRNHSSTAAAADITIKGKVEVEMCVMRSYRFLLKLAGSVSNSEPTCGAVGVGGGAGSRSPQAGSGSTVSRHRVLSSVAATGGGSPRWEDSEGVLATCESIGNSNKNDKAATNSRRGHGHSNNSSSNFHQPVVFVTNTNEMVDVCEIDMSGHICFSPPCITEDTLLTYVAAPAPALLAPASRGRYANSENSNSTSNLILSAALTGGPDGSGNVVVRNCYLQADPSHPNAQALSLEVEVANPVHGLQLLVRLPHRRCRMLNADTDGVGSVHQPLRCKPHRLVWNIGTVDATTITNAAAAREEKRNRTRNGRGKKPKKHAEKAAATDRATEATESGTRVEVVDSETEATTIAAAVASDADDAQISDADVREAILCDPALGVRLLIARCTIVYQRTGGNLYDDNGESSSDGDETSGARGDENSNGDRSDFSADSEGDDALFASVGSNGTGAGIRGGRHNSSNSNKLRRSCDGRAATPPTNMRNSNSVGTSCRFSVATSDSVLSRLKPLHAAPATAAGASSAPNQSTKSARRDARQQRKREEKQRRRQEAVLSSKGASMRLPTVEVTYSANGLASGTNVKKLQVVSDRPNWVPRSLFDRYVLEKLLRGLADMKLQRYAHYTTWFVQAVPVTPL